MNTRSIILAAAAALMMTPASAQGQMKWYGFIRNYLAVDTRESVAGTEDFFYYVPKDQSLNAAGEDLNERTSMRYAALTSRLGVDVSGYEFDGFKMGAKIEADFYNGVSGVTGTAVFRMRQAYLTLAKGNTNLKLGQAWHPMAADMPDVVSLNTGAPFGAFSRTPLAQWDYKLGDKGVSLTGAAIWQMQYTSAGPDGASANYIKYGCTPELFLGINFKGQNGLVRVGADMLSIKPRNIDATTKVKVDDRITTFTAFVYGQYAKNDFSIKAKSSFGEAGEHVNLNGGYGVCNINSDGSWDYSATRNSSTWVSLKYGKKVQGILFAGYVKNFGTAEKLVSKDMLYFSKNSFSNMNSMWRLTPTVAYNIGKFQLALEYEVTSIQYGKWGAEDLYGLATQDLHWITNNRLLLMTKFTF